MIGEWLQFQNITSRLKIQTYQMRTITTTMWCRVLGFVLLSILFIYTVSFMLKTEENGPNKNLSITENKAYTLTIDSSCKLKNNTFTTSKISDLLPLWEQTVDFDQLNNINEVGSPDGCYLVPNYVHFIWFGNKPINYLQMVCILAAFKNQKPEKLFFHFDNNNTFTGKFWKTLEQTPGFMDIVQFRDIELPDEIFGQKLNREWRTWHGSDIARIKTMMKYGGVFLDNDCYLVKNINRFRKFEISMNWDENQLMGSQVIVAHKDARFLKRWLDSYRDYDGSQWYYNAGEKPTTEILQREPHLIHRVKVWFGVDTKFKMNIFQEQWEKWNEFYVLHLLMRHQSDLGALRKYATFPVEFNEKNIVYYPITFRDMAYDVYNTANVNWSKANLDPPSLFDAVNFM
uniref:Alpha-1,4-N-acetylglucosaminyltransferase n=1 Tax=Graphocephala atropunctata TaxID=36148 RepID=A0A1B6ML50_9HEMI